MTLGLTFDSHCVNTITRETHSGSGLRVGVGKTSPSQQGVPMDLTSEDLGHIPRAPDNSLCTSLKLLVGTYDCREE